MRRVNSVTPYLAEAMFGTGIVLPSLRARATKRDESKRTAGRRGTRNDRGLMGRGQDIMTVFSSQASPGRIGVTSVSDARQVALGPPLVTTTDAGIAGPANADQAQANSAHVLRQWAHEGLPTHIARQIGADVGLPGQFPGLARVGEALGVAREPQVVVVGRVFAAWRPVPYSVVFRACNPAWQPGPRRLVRPSNRPSVCSRGKPGSACVRPLAPSTNSTRSTPSTEGM